MQNEQNKLTGGAMSIPSTGHTLPTTLVQNLTPEKECPNCSSAWSNEEIELQHCECCGYPLHHEQKTKKEEEFDFSNLYSLH
jgi:predicted amidophosphoribosyltransferase